MIDSFSHEGKDRVSLHQSRLSENTCRKPWGPVDRDHGGLSTRLCGQPRWPIDRQSKPKLPIGVSMYLLHPSISCKLCTNTKELKNSTIKIFHPLITILHLGEDFSNLNQRQYSIMSTLSGCTNLVAYVPPTQGIKPFVVYPDELHRAQAT